MNTSRKKRVNAWEEILAFLEEQVPFLKIILTQSPSCSLIRLYDAYYSDHLRIMCPIVRLVISTLLLEPTIVKPVMCMVRDHFDDEIVV